MIPDTDGYCSAAILINYLTNVFPNINLNWHLHEGKQHGIILKEIPANVNLVIIPDAGSNQFEEHKQLKENGIDVIVLDHHECERESEDAIVVNNQLSPNYPNKTLTGAAIVYKFLKALDHKLGINQADNFLDLVAVGLIGDMADSRELETRYYIQRGLSQINNSFLKALYEKQSFSTKGVINIVNTQFYIVPLINACIRVGNLQEKLQMMNAFLESKEIIFNSQKEEHEYIQTATAKMLANIKQRQRRLRDKGVAAIEERIKEKQLDKNKILIINVTDILDKNLTGLVANSLAKQYKRPVLLLRYNEEENVFSGSGRGYDKGVIKDLKSFLQKTGKFIYVEGHKEAHGVSIEVDKLIELNELINEQLKDVEINVDLYEVDFIIPATQLHKQFINEIDQHKDIWGYKVEEPLIAIKDIEVNKDDVYIIGSKKNTLKFSYNGIEYIKFFSNEEEWEQIVSKGERLVLDIVGKAGINEWNGEIKPQIRIENYSIKNTKKKEWVF